MHTLSNGFHTFSQKAFNINGVGGGGLPNASKAHMNSMSEGDRYLVKDADGKWVPSTITKVN